MRFRSPWPLLLLVTALLASPPLTGSVARAEITEIHVVGDRTYAPYESCHLFFDAEGILVEQWRLMGKRNAIRIIYRCLDWSEAQQAVVNKQADALGGMVRSKSREQRFRFIRPLAKNPPQHLYFNVARYYNGDPTLEDLAKGNQPVGVVTGDFATEWLTDHFPTMPLKAYPNYEAVVRGALNQEIFVFTMEESVASHHLNALGIEAHFRRSANPIFQEDLWAAVEKDNLALFSTLTQAFSKVSDAELSDIEIKWRGEIGPLAQYANRVSRTFDDHPRPAVLVTLSLAYAAMLGVLYLAAPLLLYRAAIWLRRLDTPVVVWPFDKIQLRFLLIVGFLETSGRVLDAFLADRREVMLQNFGRRKTVRDREAFFFANFVVDGDRIDANGVLERKRQLIFSLRPALAKRPGCVVIAGDGGSGKTSLACWIARHALQIADQGIARREGLFPRLTVPIILEGELGIGLLNAIHGQFNALIQEKAAPEVLAALLGSGRAIVLVDGLSELGEASRRRFSNLDPKLPHFSLVVTSRLEEKGLLGGVPRTEVRPCKLSATLLAAFLEFCLRRLGIREQLSDPQLFASCERLSKLVGKSEVSPLLVVLYSQLLAAEPPWSDAIPNVKDEPSLFLDYVGRLNAAVAERRNLDEVHRALRLIARACLSQSFQPTSCITGELFDSADVTPALLQYLATKLGLIEFLSGQALVRFVLDPLAEFYAAFYYFEEGAKQEQQWRNFAGFAKDPNNRAIAQGFCRALCHVLRWNPTFPSRIPASVQPEIAAALGLMDDGPHAQSA